MLWQSFLDIESANQFQRLRRHFKNVVSVIVLWSGERLNRPPSDENSVGKQYTITKHVIVPKEIFWFVQLPTCELEPRILAYLRSNEADCDNILRIECCDGARYVLPALHKKSKMSRFRKYKPVYKESAAQCPTRSKKGRRIDGFSANHDLTLFHFLGTRSNNKVRSIIPTNACDSIFSFGLMKAVRAWWASTNSSK